MTAIETIEDCDAAGLPAHHIEAFLEHLREAGYSEVTRRKKRTILTALARWMKLASIPLAQLDESVITAFVKRSTGAPASRAQFKRAVLRLLLADLRSEANVCWPAQVKESPIDGTGPCYVDYLRQDLGLAENSVHVYAPFIREFLRSQEVGDDGCLLPGAFDATTIRSYRISN